MAKYNVKIEATVSCSNDADAKAAAEELRKLFANPLVKVTLVARGVSLVGTPAISFEKK